jgi:hypothetical protein
MREVVTIHLAGLSHTIYIGGKLYKQSVKCITLLMVKYLYINLTARILKRQQSVGVVDIFSSLVGWFVGCGCGVVVAATFVLQ